MISRIWAPAALVLGVLLASADPTPSAAQSWYVSGALGASFREPTKSSTSSPFDPFGNSGTTNGQPDVFQYVSRETYATGFDADATVGRVLAAAPFGRLRGELDFEFRRFQQSALNTQRLPSLVEPYPYIISARTQSGLNSDRYAGTANVFYDLTILDWVHPYVGAGVGYQHGSTTAGVRSRTVYTSFGGTPVTQTGDVSLASGSDSDGTYLLEAGLTFPLTRRLSLSPAYRYTDTFGGDHGTHIAKLGLRYSF